MSHNVRPYKLVQGDICSLDSCAEPRNCKGLCARHYQRLLRLGDPWGRHCRSCSRLWLDPGGAADGLRLCPTCRDRPCAVESCSSPSKTRGFCSTHYMWTFSYGLSDEEVHEFAQRGACQLCRATDDLVIDHCHGTGEVRGVLCNPCNRGLGQFGDDPERLRAAASYLETAR